jgi:Zn-dependent metalloprotease
MQKQLYFVVFLVLGMTTILFGQNLPNNQKQKTEDYRFFKNDDTRLNHVNFFEMMRSKMQLSPASNMVLLKQDESSDQPSHYKYQQYHDDIPVWGATYTLHEKNGSIYRATGNYYAGITQSASPTLNESTATIIAKKAMKKGANIAVKAAARLCYVDADFPKVSQTVRLAYQLDLQVEKPLDKQRYFVDASTGKIISHYTLIQKEGVPSKAKTKYYGTKNITTDSVAPNKFILEDKTRGKGIFVKNIDDKSFTSTSKNWNLDNAKFDEVALDAHYCSQEYYDLLKNKFSWKSIDGKGEKPINIFVHLGYDEVNAYWDGNGAYFGDGDCEYNPLTTLEVVGHELTHGLIENTSNLVYEYESGAINESLADIFGKYLEHKKDSANFSWDLGHSIIVSDTSKPFRYMDNPKLLEMPALYEGEFWEEENDVHINSSIGNLWFSLIVDGKKGVNENKIPFDVSAIGFDKAMKIVFETNKNYFGEQSNYNDFYQYSSAVAEDLYGVNSKEYLAVVEAWKAVGIPSNGNNIVGIDLYIKESSFTTICANINEKIPLTISIKNQGSVDFVPTATSKIKIEISGKTYTVKLDSSIASGKTIQFTTSPFLKVTNFIQISAQLTLIIDDVNIVNNNVFLSYGLAKKGSKDIRLNSVYCAKSDCFKEDVFGLIEFTNNGCENIPAGETLKLIAKNKAGTNVWDTTFVLKSTLEPSYFIELSFEFVTKESTLDWIFEYDKDDNTSNNSLKNYKIKGLASTIDASYNNDFENLATVDEKMSATGSLKDYLIDIKGNSVFACTGYLPIEYFKKSCRFAPDIFKSNTAPISASIRTCVDFSKYNSSVLEFDVMEYRNSKADSLKYPYSAMLEAKWTGTENGNSIIYGNPEGVLKHYKFALPKGFKGEVSFNMNTDVGQYIADVDQLEEDDFIILDNVKFSTGTVGVTTPSESDHTTISPNPTTGKITVQSNSAIATLELYNVNGQLIKKQEIEQRNNSELDLSIYQSGIYILKIISADKKILTRKIVKME